MDEATLLSSFRMFLLRVLLIVNYSPPSRCTRLEEGASIRRSLVSRLRGVKFTGRFLTVQTLQTILCSELTPASQPVLCKVILYSQYIFCLFYYILSCLLITIHHVTTFRAKIDSIRQFQLLMDMTAVDAGLAGRKPAVNLYKLLRFALYDSISVNIPQPLLCAISNWCYVVRGSALPFSRFS